MLYSTRYASPVGPLTLASDGQSLVGLWMAGQKYFGGTVKGDFCEQDDLPVLADARKWLDAYFAGKKPAIAALPLAPAGAEFRQSVWGILCEIPYGGYVTYGEIAKQMAVRMNKKNMSSQAVGGAVGHNPISIIIPCHRVVGANGSLTGYAGGIGKKIKLLELEGVDTSNFFVPSKGTAL
ncbi:MAG: methylated-DNA--[protein]-cysteine S-methyltransferase [Desulfobulbus sp.]|uniref:methylated-DNA--[protein]-cysteine S-methyltransferase n=1 Tax=Desulfobulbus sp. TaxID=895 RepID=UPI002847ECE2|nr:methylated-DNA--[protein]-cysteine S-methyltransferase [Desulfobulbus sp.]MDR2549415.1 methylated-DNA--[protein]-cysteine S-methyltransferase [Desulfobulbus sp.]